MNPTCNGDVEDDKEEKGEGDTEEEARLKERRRKTEERMRSRKSVMPSPHSYITLP